MSQQRIQLRQQIEEMIQQSELFAYISGETTDEHADEVTEKVTDSILEAIQQRDAYCIGEEEEEPINVEHPYHEQYCYETRLNNTKRSEIESKMKETLK